MRLAICPRCHLPDLVLLEAGDPLPWHRWPWRLPWRATPVVCSASCRTLAELAELATERRVDGVGR